MIRKRFYPDERAESVWKIDYRAQWERGIRGIIFDIDNTLVPQDQPVTEDVVQLFQRIHEIGFRTCVISNNAEERVRPVGEQTESFWVCHARKPLRRSYRKAMDFLGTEPSATLFVGDQLLTDIFGANRLGIPNILVRPVSLESDIPTVRFKRKIEKWVLKSCENQEST